MLISRVAERYQYSRTGSAFSYDKINISKIVRDIEKSIGEGKSEAFSADYKKENLTDEINEQLLQQRKEQYNFDN
ncbi:MAG: hypothetical protein NC120_11170, partial [Ruminococcus sp.]|nr:hypothetical protein [Ruminococcus sp.]